MRGKRLATQSPARMCTYLLRPALYFTADVGGTCAMSRGHESIMDRKAGRLDAYVCRAGRCCRWLVTRLLLSASTVVSASAPWEIEGDLRGGSAEKSKLEPLGPWAHEMSSFSRKAIPGLRRAEWKVIGEAIYSTKSQMQPRLHLICRLPAQNTEGRRSKHALYKLGKHSAACVVPATCEQACFTAAMPFCCVGK